MSTVREDTQDDLLLIPRLTPSVAEAIRAAAETAAAHSEQGGDVCGLLIADAAAPDVVDAMEIIPCQQGAGFHLSAEEEVQLREKVKQVSAFPQRRIVGFVRTSGDRIGVAMQENASLREMVPTAYWLFVAKAFADGSSRARVFRSTGDGWSQAADLELGRSHATRPTPLHVRAAAAALTMIGGVPPAVAAAVAGLAVLAVGWACLHLPASPPPADLGMRVGADGNMLGVSWDRQLAGVSSSQGGDLSIDDAGQHRNVHLDPAQVANGLVLYRPGSDDVTFRLEIHGGNRGSVRGTVHWIDAAGKVARGERPGTPPAAGASGDDLVAISSHPAVARAAEAAPAETRLQASAAKPATAEGLARFVVRTPGVRVTIRRAGEPHSREQVVTAPALRLSAGYWIVHASAPGYVGWSGRFLVNRAGPADVFIRLRQARHGRVRAGTSDRLRAAK